MEPVGNDGVAFAIPSGRAPPAFEVASPQRVKERAASFDSIAPFSQGD
jgi:hypothetical protein